MLLLFEECLLDVVHRAASKARPIHAGLTSVWHDTELLCLWYLYLNFIPL